MADIEFPPIQQRLMRFIRDRFQPGYNHYNVAKLLGDASSRQYYRYFTDSGASYILAAYPESFEPTCFTYKEIYDLLQSIDIPVPEIIEMDGPLGIVLQEDLGNELLQKTLIHAGEKQKKLLLKTAIDHIITIQKEGTEAFKPEYQGYHLFFDEEKLSWEFNFFRKHYLGNYRKAEVYGEEELFEEFRKIAAELAGYPRVLCHRDFHVRNMMMKNGILHVIDFQDARWGPVTYDLASLSKDSLDLDPDTVDELIQYYLEKVDRRKLPGVDSNHFLQHRFQREFHLMCIQRLLKALGTYGYQIIVRENFIYEQYMAGSLHRVLLSLRALDEFPHICRMVEKELESR
jgi:aminoglycoside/choline kinase family phosphotransferase